MDSLPQGLRELRDRNPDVAQVLDTYSNISRAYRRALAATGRKQAPIVGVRNSAEVTFSSTPKSSTTTIRSERRG